MKFVQVPITSAQTYQAMRDRGVDFCDGCGGRTCLTDLKATPLETKDGFARLGVVCGPCRQTIADAKETSPSCLQASDSF